MEQAPHKTVIWITAITYDVLKTGELSGNPTRKIEDVYQVSGDDKIDCLKKTDKLMEEIKNATKVHG